MVNFVDIKSRIQSVRPELENAIGRVLDSCAFTAGDEVSAFEKEFAKAQGSCHCIGANNGTSALHLALWALDIGPGDEVIVPANTFIATAEAVSLTGAKPVFVDCQANDYTIDPGAAAAAATTKTRAIIPVHLYGQPADMIAICEWAKSKNIAVVEDCAQAHLAAIGSQKIGNFGDVGCFSFYPSKNLGACGDAGGIVTNRDDLAHTMRILLDHGSSQKYLHRRAGHNYRMGGIQAAALSVNLKRLETWTHIRRQVAHWYMQALADISEIVLPAERPDIFHVYHLFVVQTPQREKLIAHLKANDIHTGIHYPIPCHLQEAYTALGQLHGSCPHAEANADRLLSLPMHEFMTESDVSIVASAIKEFFRA